MVYGSPGRPGGGVQPPARNRGDKGA